jgi:two-component system CheB/CheR fusion protein
VKENLHSTNESPAGKVADLDCANADLRNLYDSTRIATVFLDSQMVVRSFSPAIGQIFGLIDSDRGRPLTDIASFIDHAALGEDVTRVLITGEAVERQVTRRDGKAHFLMRALPYQTEGEGIEGAVVTFFDVTAYLVEAEAHQRVLLAELNHRVKNVLAVVTAMARQMARRSGTVETFTAALARRLQGLARVHDLLATAGWTEISMLTLVRSEIDATTHGSQATIAGADITLGPRTATTIAMVLHELATNAARHGALSTAEGRVAFNWRRDGEQVLFEWRELGGPVPAPGPPGYGSDMMTRLVEYELGGTIAFNYTPKGLTVAITAPLSSLSTRKQAKDAAG